MDSKPAAEIDQDVLASYDYELPPERIAQVPAAQRDQSRLCVVNRTSGEIEHRRMTDFPSLLRPQDVLILNETRVIPARLSGVRTRTGGKWQGLFLNADAAGRWRLLGRTRGKLQPGETITVHSPRKAAGRDVLPLRLLECDAEGAWLAEPESPGDALELLDRFGAAPLPPYIERDQPRSEDLERYQTVFARTPGAVAAPTAGLHFTERLLAACRERGANIAGVTLHVGPGTFRPIASKRLSEHHMHREWCELPAETVSAVTAAREQGGRVIAVGTTTVRTLESVAASGPLRPWRGETDLFIRPPYTFRVVDALLTNFHLPRSTLLVLVCAFADRDLVLRAYRAAIEAEYRFYSYGDAMFLC